MYELEAAVCFLKINQEQINETICDKKISIYLDYIT